MDQAQLDLREALKLAATSLKQSQVPFALMGSYALWAWGGPEPAHDVDFLVAHDDASEAAQALCDGGFTVVEPAEDWLLKAYLDRTMVDVIFRAADRKWAQREDVQAAQPLQVLSVEMPVLMPTELVIHRLQALDEHYCDLGTQLPAIRALREKVDWPRVRRECGDNDFAAALLFLLQRLGVVEEA